MNKAILLVLLLQSTLAFSAGKPKPASLDPDLNLLDFSVQPFSDQGSHFVLRRLPSQGFFALELRSGYAFGSEAAQDHASKSLLKLQWGLELEGGELRFLEGVSVTAQDYPRWIMERAEEEGFKAEGGIAFVETDAVSGALNFINRGKKPLKLRPVLILKGGAEGFDSRALFEPKGGVLTLTLDRSKLLNRKLKETLCFVLGTAKPSASFGDPEKPGPLSEAPQVKEGAFSARLNPSGWTALKPGEALRLPFCFSLNLDEAKAREEMPRLLSRWTLPKGEAMAKAKARWAVTSSRAPKPGDLRFGRLARASFTTLLMAQYAKRGELRSDMFSQAKGFRDAFSSDGMPLIALGWSEIDYGAAEAALLELSSFAAAAALPVPPHTGEELLPWEAGGLPLHGLAAWELFLRDPEVVSNRPRTFMGAMGNRLRNESAWWPGNRDGDGNGLYAYARAEEKPWLPSAGSLSASAEPELPTYSVALSSVLAWHFQAAAALAQGASDEEEAQKLQALSLKTSGALKSKAKSPEGRYEQGYDGYLPYALGLDSDGRPAMEALAKEALEGQGPPFVEGGLLNPAQAYWLLRGLSLWGYREAAQKAAEGLLGFLDAKPAYSAYALDGRGLGAPGDAGTAAVALETAMERYEQEALLLADTVKLEGRLLQVRAPDGSFLLKRVGLPLDKRPYAQLSLASGSQAPILTSGEFWMEAQESMSVLISGQKPFDVSDSKGQLLIKERLSEYVFLKPKQKVKVRIISR